MKKKQVLGAALGVGFLFMFALTTYGLDSQAWWAPFEALSAQEKYDSLWDQTDRGEYPAGMLPVNGTSAYKLLTSLGPAFLRTTFLHQADFMPSGRKKVIHTFGATAQAEIQINPSSPYTGILSSGALGIVRLSLATLGGSFTPGIALKALIDGKASVNFIAMYSLDGQGKDTYFFANDFCTEVAEPRGIALKLGALAFKNALLHVPNAPDSPIRLPLEEASSIRSDGSLEGSPRFPEVLCFSPTAEVRAVTAATAGADTDFRVALRELEAPLPLYSIRARSFGEHTWETIGQVVLKSTLKASRFADEQLFFAHQRKVLR